MYLPACKLQESGSKLFLERKKRGGLWELGESAGGGGGGGWWEEGGSFSPFSNGRSRILPHPDLSSSVKASSRSLVPGLDCTP